MDLQTILVKFEQYNSDMFLIREFNEEFSKYNINFTFKKHGNMPFKDYLQYILGWHYEDVAKVKSIFFHVEEDV